MLMPLIQHFFSWQGTAFVDPILALAAPSLFLYIKSFKEVITFRKAWPHFIFFVANILADFWFYRMISIKYPLSQKFPDGALHHPLLIATVSARIGQLLVYYFLSWKTLSAYQRSIRQIFSETSRINLNWVRWLISCHLFLIVFMTTVFLSILWHPEQFALLSLVHSAVLTPYIYIITYKSIAQPTLWQPQQHGDKSRVEQEMREAATIHEIVEQKEKNVSQPDVDAEKWKHILDRIIHLMDHDKIYQEPELTLQQLAGQLELHSYLVSQALNDGLKKNFYDLINGRRVEEAKRLLLNPKNQNYTILSVGFEAGFNSKTTFNTVFKKFTGLTPTEYRDKQKQSQLIA